jgi:TPR repeat protein
MTLLLAGVAADRTKAYEWMCRGVLSGRSDHHFKMAIFYNDGIGCSRDDKLAAHYFSLAAHRGHNEAAGRLALYYEYGIPMPLS